jgi:formylglycine-generating enzyme
MKNASWFRLSSLVLVTATAMSSLGSPASPDMVFVKGGSYEPFFREKGEGPVVVGDLLVDKDPVTNEKFSKFVKAHPRWKRSRVPSIFAAKTYLESWSGDEAYGASAKNQPVTSVSWFAARAYCASAGKRLLTVDEWEWVSDAQNPDNLQLILEWYSKPGRAPMAVTKASVNKHGLRGMHGLVWEWVEDFSSVIIAGDSRDANDTKAGLFCGAGSLMSKDPSQYATFMRYAHRSSLQAAYVGNSLGFRCARSAGH